jgi:cytoskeletal protein CcmA (bactofilin family)
MISDKDFLDFNYNVIGGNSFIKGDLTLCGHTIITSHIEGSIEIKDQGKLILERGSKIQGKVQAFDLDIYGEVQGDIESSGLVSIRSSALVSGSIKCARLVVYPGAKVEMKAISEETNS